MEKMKGSARRQAAFAVAAWRASGAKVKNLLPDGPDRAFVQDIAYTAIRRWRTLEACLERFVRRGQNPEREALLAVGAAQILFMPDVPDYAAVAETVAAAKPLGRGAAGFVNAVLRNIARNKDDLLGFIAASPPAVRESFPDGLYKRWRERFGEEGALALMRWHNEPAETFIAGKDGSFTPLARGKKVAEEPGYAEGLFIVQNPGTKSAIDLVAPASGETILDLCAAPGGKTAQMAWRGAAVTACEINAARRVLLEENVKRLGLDVEIASGPAAASRKEWDKVLVDAPCSNTGVLRSRPEARWSWSAKKLDRLVSTQAEILDLAASLVKPGGLLVYSTCSNEPEENAEQSRAFLARHSGFSPAGEKENIPHVSGTDGAYAAAFARRKA